MTAHSVTARLGDGPLGDGPSSQEVGPPNATVRFTTDDYITLLHPTVIAIQATESRFDLLGDPAALGALLATFD
jgi:hypothetical protein